MEVLSSRVLLRPSDPARPRVLRGGAGPGRRPRVRAAGAPGRRLLPGQRAARGLGRSDEPPRAGAVAAGARRRRRARPIGGRRGAGHPAPRALERGGSSRCGSRTRTASRSCWSRFPTTTPSAATSDEWRPPREARNRSGDWVREVRRTAVRPRRGDDEGMPCRPLRVLGALVLLAGCSSGATMPRPTSAPADLRERDRAGAALSAPARDSRQWRHGPGGAGPPAQVAQLFLVGVPLEDLGSGDALAVEGVGGLFLAGRSEGPRDRSGGDGRSAGSPSRRARTSGWRPTRRAAPCRPSRARASTRLPSAATRALCPPDQLVRTRRAAWAPSSLAAGVNLNLAPVADVVPAGTETANEPIGAFDRQYGSTAPEVTAAAGAVVDGLAGARGDRHPQALPPAWAGCRATPTPTRGRRRRHDDRRRRAGGRLRRAWPARRRVRS